MLFVIIVILFLLNVFLIYKLQQKKIIDNKKEYEQLQQLNENIQKAQEEYNNQVETMEERLSLRQTALNRTYETTKEAKQQALRLLVEQAERDKDKRLAAIAEELAAREEQNAEFLAAKTQQEKELQNKIESLLEPLRNYEREKQEKLFYTVQVPENYRADIDYLLNNVADKIEHPDIISKLVWSEYVKPNLDETFKRIAIKEEPGIYKLTNINDQKCYIGKSANVKKRIADHYRGSVGIKNIADQAVHHAMLETGLWNWTIEIITYCNKDQLNELEKYYIDFFKSQELGFNKNSGG